ncbi:pilin [Patescibacteria group bacterium]|nr:pilin [Patescibacteria group bacterium]
MKPAKKICIIIIFISLLTIIFSYQINNALAFTQSEKYKGYLDIAREQSGYNTINDVSQLPARIIVLILGFVGIIFLILIIISGFQWMTASGNEEKISSARKRIINASIGLGITLCAFIISYGIFKLFYEQTLQVPSGGIEPPPGAGEIIPCSSDIQCEDRSPRIYCLSGNCVECIEDAHCTLDKYCHPSWHACLPSP